MDKSEWKKRFPNHLFLSLTSLQVFIWGIIKSPRYWQSTCTVRACASTFYAFPYNLGCKWSLWEQRMRPLPSMSLIKSKLLSLPLYLLRSLPLSLFSKSEKNDVSLSVRAEPHRSSFGFISAIRRLMAARWRFFNGLWTSFSAWKAFVFTRNATPLFFYLLIFFYKDWKCGSCGQTCCSVWFCMVNLECWSSC